jgi:hypothetical protein
MRGCGHPPPPAPQHSAQAGAFEDAPGESSVIGGRWSKYLVRAARGSVRHMSIRSWAGALLPALLLLLDLAGAAGESWSQVFPREGYAEGGWTVTVTGSFDGCEPGPASTLIERTTPLIQTPQLAVFRCSESQRSLPCRGSTYRCRFDSTRTDIVTYTKYSVETAIAPTEVPSHALADGVARVPLASPLPSAVHSAQPD